MTSPEPMANLLAAWKQATDVYLSTWTQAFEAMSGVPGAEALQKEVSANALGARAAMNEVTREVFEPLVELSGTVPLGDFRRLADEVHTILLRLDRIDDALRRLAAAPPEPGAARAAAPGPKSTRRAPGAS